MLKNSKKSVMKVNIVPFGPNSSDTSFISLGIGLLISKIELMTKAYVS